MKFTNTTSISDAMHSKMSLEPVSNFWRAMHPKNYNEIYHYLKYSFATNWLAKITSRYLRLFGDFGAYETRDFVEDHITFQISSEIQYKIKREIRR
jgi:hypothetical protein